MRAILGGVRGGGAVEDSVGVSRGRTGSLDPLEKRRFAERLPLRSGLPSDTDMSAVETGVPPQNLIQ